MTFFFCFFCTLSIQNLAAAIKKHQNWDTSHKHPSLFLFYLFLSLLSLLSPLSLLYLFYLFSSSSLSLLCLPLSLSCFTYIVYQCPNHSQPQGAKKQQIGSIGEGLLHSMSTLCWALVDPIVHSW
jgi:hypothetical protein